MNHIFIAHSPTDGHLGWSHLLAIINIAAITGLCKYVCGRIFVQLFGYRPKNGIGGDCYIKGVIVTTA